MYDTITAIDYMHVQLRCLKWSNYHVFCVVLCPLKLIYNFVGRCIFVEPAVVGEWWLCLNIFYSKVPITVDRTYS